MNFDLSPDELAFQREVEAFLAANASSEVMDANPEQLSQTVDTPAKRAFMRKLAERGWLGMSWPKQYGGQEKSGIYDFILTEALSRWGRRSRQGRGDRRQDDHPPRQRAAEAVLPAAHHPRRDRVRDRLQRAAGRLGRGEHAAACAEGRRRLEARRPQDLDDLGPLRRLVLGRRAHRREREAQGITLFLVEMDHPGLTIHPTWTIGDERTNEVFFDDVSSPTSSSSAR
jgi:hypothetical protein